MKKVKVMKKRRNLHNKNQKKIHLNKMKVQAIMNQRRKKIKNNLLKRKRRKVDLQMK